MNRIDHITITLDVYEEFEGRKSVTFSPVMPDLDLEAIVRQKWQEYEDRLLAQARIEGTNLG